MRVFAASHLFPVSSAPIRDGAVAVRGSRIVAVGSRAAVIEKAGRGVEVSELGRVALIPGLVNAHCHVELSWMAADPPPTGDYVAWVRGLIARRADQEASAASSAAERAIEFMLSRGTVALGDIANELWVAPLLGRSPLRGVIFHELFEPRAALAEELLDQAGARLEAATAERQNRWRILPTPHAPHTTSAPLLRALGELSTARGTPLSIHVAESRAELALLADAAGGFVELFRERGVWEDDRQPQRRTPVAWLDELGLLTPRTLAVHCVHLTAADRVTLRARGVHVVTCPRSNERLQVGLAPVPALLAEGIPVALGTDSLASAPDLDLFGEMAALCRLHPQLTAETVLRIATLNGAAALGLADELGSIEAGKLAELIVVPLAADDEDPLQTLCSVPDEVRRLDAVAAGAGA